MGLIDHLADEGGSNLLLFLAGLEAALTSSGGVIGEDTSLPVILDFLDGKLVLEKVNECIRIASRPESWNLQMVRALGFTERVVEQMGFFYRALPLWAVDDQNP